MLDREDKDRSVDKLLDRALQEYGNPEPPLGLEQRVLSRLREVRSRRNRRILGSAALLAASVLLAILVLPLPEDQSEPVTTEFAELSLGSDGIFFPLGSQYPASPESDDTSTEVSGQPESVGLAPLVDELPTWSSDSLVFELLVADLTISELEIEPLGGVGDGDKEGEIE